MKASRSISNFPFPIICTERVERLVWPGDINRIYLKRDVGFHSDAWHEVMTTPPFAAVFRQSRRQF